MCDQMVNIDRYHFNVTLSVNLSRLQEFEIFNFENEFEISKSCWKGLQMSPKHDWPLIGQTAKIAYSDWLITELVQICNMLLWNLNWTLPKQPNPKIKFLVQDFLFGKGPV